MDYESERTRKLGCWDGFAACTGPINAWTTSEPTPNFEPDLDFPQLSDRYRLWQKLLRRSAPILAEDHPGKLQGR